MIVLSSWLRVPIGPRFSPPLRTVPDIVMSRAEQLAERRAPKEALPIRPVVRREIRLRRLRATERNASSTSTEHRTISPQPLHPTTPIHFSTHLSSPHRRA